MSCLPARPYAALDAEPLSGLVYPRSVVSGTACTLSDEQAVSFALVADNSARLVVVWESGAPIIEARCSPSLGDIPRSHRYARRPCAMPRRRRAARLPARAGRFRSVIRKHAQPGGVGAGLFQRPRMSRADVTRRVRPCRRLSNILACAPPLLPAPQNPRADHLHHCLASWCASRHAQCASA